MLLWELVGLLGWVTAISFAVALSNYLVKFVHKKWISKLPKTYESWVLRYRVLMKWVIKLHRPAGFVAFIGLLSHFALAFSQGRLSLTGFISAIVLLGTFSMGIYGAFFKKSPKGSWLRLHRLMAFALIVTISAHVLL